MYLVIWVSGLLSAKHVLVLAVFENVSNCLARSTTMIVIILPMVHRITCVCNYTTFGMCDRSKGVLLFDLKSIKSIRS